MGDTGRLHLNPADMNEKAAQFDQRCEEFNSLVTTMGTMVADLTEEWEGQSSQSFYNQFEALKKGFGETAELITEIAAQLREVSMAMMTADEQISQKIGY